MLRELRTATSACPVVHRDGMGRKYSRSNRHFPKIGSRMAGGESAVLLGSETQVLR